MDKRKVICNAIFLALTIFTFIGCLVGIGFQSFEIWQELGELFQDSFFIGMLYLCLPIALICTMLLILVALYALLRALNVIKENAFDKYFVIIRRVVIIATIICLMFILTGTFNGFGK